MNSKQGKIGQKRQQVTSGLAKLGAEVIIRISVCPLTCGDSPNCVQLTPNFAKPLGRYRQVGQCGACGQ